MILVTGACGYKGTVLVPKLLALGHKVRAIDTMWFGNHLPDHPNLEVVNADIIDTASVNFDDVRTVIHLASVANDPTGDLNPKLTWETSCLATMTLADKAVRNGVKQFIYASSGSVYGVQDSPDVTEELELLPLSEYNKTKMVSERVLLSHREEMAIQIVRPATVCGVSKRMRLDVSVNLLTHAALSRGTITVFGGEQVRPNIHIDDICDLYVFLVDNPQVTGIYNAGFENLSILDIAKVISERLGVDIEITGSSDPRSYRLNSNRLLATGFKPKKSVKDAIEEIIVAYQNGNKFDDPSFHNLKWMQSQMLASAGDREVTG